MRKKNKYKKNKMNKQKTQKKKEACGMEKTRVLSHTF
jgi:hypothetical protein